MYVIIEENPNCAADERVFPIHGKKRTIQKIFITPPGKPASVWCDVAGVREGGSFRKASGQLMDDSSDGTAWLIFGEEWGLRLKPSQPPAAWSLEDKTQWGLPFLVLDGSGAAIEFE